MTTNNHTPIPSSPKQPANATTINAPLGQLDAAVGDLSTLTTTAKTSAVAAINEANHGFGSEPPAVSSSTSGSAGTAATASRSDHSHDLGVHAHASSANGGQIDAVNVLVTNLPANLLQVGDYLLGLRNGVASKVAFGAGNGIDVDMLDGNHASAFATAGHGHVHSALSSLLNDDHTQYQLLVGRAGGQSIIGGTASGNNLELISTSHATKGLIKLGAASAFDEVNSRLGIGLLAPTAIIDSQGTVPASLGSDLVSNGEFDTSTGWTPGTGWTIKDTGYYKFTVSGITTMPSPGTTYTNNGVTYTVNNFMLTGSSPNISGTLYCTGASNPIASGTLTKAAGTGDATISFSAFALNYVAEHATGNATTLVKTLSLTSGAFYQVSFIVYTTATGVLMPKLGTALGVAVGQVIGTPTQYSLFPNNAYFETVIVANGNDLTFSSDATWSGWVDIVAVKLLIPATTSQIWRDSSGNIRNQLFANGAGNLFLGTSAVGAFSQVAGQNNVGLGAAAFQRNSTGTFNVAIGGNAMGCNTIGYYNVAIGQDTLFNNATGVYNTAIGSNACYGNTTGNHNVGLGINALNKNTVGRANIAIGAQCMQEGTAMNFNLAIGAFAMYSNTGHNNTAVGYQALMNKTSGDSNVAIGFNAGYGQTNGGNNTFIGSYSGQNNAGSGNVFLGFNAGYSEPGSNKLYIENSSSTTPLILGDFANDYVTIFGKTGVYAVGASAAAPACAFEVRGNNGAPSLTPSATDIAVFLSSTSVELAMGAETNAPYYPFWLQARTRAGIAYQLALNPMGGSVGIGTKTPAAKLDTAGTIRTTGYAALANSNATIGAGMEFAYSSGAGYIFPCDHTSAFAYSPLYVDANPLYLNTTSAKDVIAPKVVITLEGGLGVKVTAGEDLTKGEVVYAPQTGGANGKVWKNPVDGDMPLGVVYANASANAEVVVVTAGIANLLPNAADTAARGYVIYSSSTTAGRVSQSATAPAATTHFRECGHWIDAGTGAGVIARAIVHFN